MSEFFFKHPLLALLEKHGLSIQSFAVVDWLCQIKECVNHIIKLLTLSVLNFQISVENQFTMISLCLTLEAIATAWFTFDYLIRLISSRNTFKFIKMTSNVIDLIANFPFYLELIYFLYFQRKLIIACRRLCEFFRH